MYSYTFDLETGGIILNSTPTNFSKEPRPVYAAEMDILGFDKHWDYEKQNEVPYMGGVQFLLVPRCANCKDEGR